MKAKILGQRLAQLQRETGCEYNPTRGEIILNGASYEAVDITVNSVGSYLIVSYQEGERFNSYSVMLDYDLNDDPDFASTPEEHERVLQEMGIKKLIQSVLDGSGVEVLDIIGERVCERYKGEALTRLNVESVYYSNQTAFLCGDGKRVDIPLAGLEYLLQKKDFCVCQAGAKVPEHQWEII